MSFRDNMQHLRATRNMTQEQLAMLLGVSRQSVSKWEAERAYPEMDKLLKMCGLFECTLDELVTGDLTGRPANGAASIPPGKSQQDVTGYDQAMRVFAWKLPLGISVILASAALALLLSDPGLMPIAEVRHPLFVGGRPRSSSLHPFVAAAVGFGTKKNTKRTHLCRQNVAGIRPISWRVRNRHCARVRMKRSHPFRHRRLQSARYNRASLDQRGADRKARNQPSANARHLGFVMLAGDGLRPQCGHRPAHGGVGARFDHRVKCKRFDRAPFPKSQAYATSS